MPFKYLKALHKTYKRSETAASCRKCNSPTDEKCIKAVKRREIESKRMEVTSKEVKSGRGVRGGVRL